MLTMMFGQVGNESKFVVALCTFGPVILAKRRNLCIGDVIAFLNLEFEQRPFHCTDMLGLRFDSGDICPDAFLVLSKPGIAPADFSCVLRLEVEIVGSLVSFQGFYHDLSNLLGLLRGTGILDMLMCVGWTCVIPITAWEDDRFNVVQIIRIPNQLAIEAIDVVHCMAIRLFISHLATLASVGCHPVIRVRIKFWSSWIWEGLWDPNSDFSLVHALWKDIMLKFGLTWDIRFIIHGHNVNFERPKNSVCVGPGCYQWMCQNLFVYEFERGGPKNAPSEQPAAARVKRKLPDPPPMPNIHERPPTPPSVPGTPPQPPTPPLPPRLRTHQRTHGDYESYNSESSGTSSESQPRSGPTFRQIIELVPDDPERALNAALDAWISTPQIDWDVDVAAIVELRMTTEGHLIYWNGTFSVLLRLIQLLQQSKLELAMARLGWLVTVQFLEFSNPVKGRVLILPRTGVPFVNMEFSSRS